MNGPSRVLFAAVLLFSAAGAEEWQTYSYPNPGFAIQFPGVPEVQTTKFKNAVGVTLPVTRYVVRRDGVEYTLRVVDYSSTNADALSTIGETARSFTAKGKVSAKGGARVNGNHGRELTITESDGSRSDIAIFFVDHHLYTAVGQAFPPHAMERSADTTRFQESLQFPGDDGGLRGLFGGGGRASSNAAPSIAAVSVSADGLSAGSAGKPVTSPNQRADAACVGKSAGDVVQLDTPTGPVPATCILTARPKPP